ncbi:Arc family DNA-binding protein [Pseudaminobacter sp. NGMCC 1.201702]|uniref:Arc family DNA-binding protein n=1 Tax=Pseudaminobacter sp. NGMCC 1.201702 TaxID=3391825 RepID=UPI0039F0F424
MTSPTLSPFPLRMPKRLKEELQAAVDRGGKSLNDEIVKRLERTFGPDDALLQLAETLRPFMDGLSEEDQATLIAAARILVKDRRKKPVGQ